MTTAQLATRRNAAHNWRRHLTCESQYCIYCWATGQKVRLGGPTILGERVDRRTFGQARYARALKRAMLTHLAATHPTVTP